MSAMPRKDVAEPLESFTEEDRVLALLDDLEQKAVDVQRTYRQAAEAAHGDPPQRRQAEARRQVEVNALQQEAAATLAAEIARLEDLLAQARAALSEQRRATLGDVIFVEILKAEVATAEAEEMMARYRYGSDIERELVSVFGLQELARRTATGRIPTAREKEAVTVLAAHTPVPVRDTAQALTALQRFKVKVLDRGV